MQIRELEEGDLGSLGALILEIYDEAPYATTFASRPGDDELAQVMRRKIEGMRSRTLADFVAVEGGRVVADCEIVKSTDTGGLIGIIVAKTYRRKGLGKRLVERCSEKAKLFKMREVYAEIDDKNQAAIGFFSSCGFREQEGEDTFTMLKALD